MGGISITIDIHQLDEGIARLGPILRFDPAELMAEVAALGESQTRRRITDEKTAPDGTPWPANRAGTPVLHQTGRNLLDSVASMSDADTAEWGATWEHTSVHQNGAVITPQTAKALRFQGPNGVVFARKVTIPARPVVGLSDENRGEISELVTDLLGALAGGRR